VTRIFGLTELEAAAIAAIQDWVCPICLDTLDLATAVVDHDHETQRVRGVLTAGCNKGLGFLKDDVGALLRAARYLRREDDVVDAAFTRLELARELAVREGTRRRADVVDALDWVA
jgi:hypothetical protein